MTGDADDTTAATAVTRVGRRLDVRVPLQGRVTVCPTGLARTERLVPAELTGRVLDLSTTGCRLVLPGLWQRGWTMALNIELPPSFIVAEAVVSWSTAAKFDNAGALCTRMGVRFSAELPARFRSTIVDTMTEAIVHGRIAS